MVKDQSKVIKLPKELQHATDAVDYMCGCQICASRVQQEVSEKHILDHAIQQVEQLLETSAFSQRDLSLQLLHPGSEISSITIEQLNEHVLRLSGNDIALTQALLSLIKFSHQFNKKYRHPLVCELHDNTLRIIQNMWRTSPSEEYHQSLLRYNGQLSFLRDQQEIIATIESEAFLSERLAQSLYAKLQKAVSEVKENAQHAMQTHYSRTSQNDYPQNIILVKPSPKMA